MNLRASSFRVLIIKGVPLSIVALFLLSGCILRFVTKGDLDVVSLWSGPKEIVVSKSGSVAIRVDVFCWRSESQQQTVLGSNEGLRTNSEIWGPCQEVFIHCDGQRIMDLLAQMNGITSASDAQKQGPHRISISPDQVGKGLWRVTTVDESIKSKAWYIKEQNLPTNEISFRGTFIEPSLGGETIEYEVGDRVFDLHISTYSVIPKREILERYEPRMLIIQADR